MENRVYYGEYSLAYWLELILSRKIALPVYQRHFVWDEEKLGALLCSIKEKRFIPPVTIGMFTDANGQKHYYIIDGQQRLTSILLAYLDIFPDKEGFRAHLTALANGTEILPEDGIDPYDNVLEWNFHTLTEKGKNKADILSHLEQNNYKTLNLGISPDFWSNHFLGFSYIVPASPSSSDQQKYYTKVFREINVQGEKLLPMESRRSLYFLNNELEGYFEPAFASGYIVKLTAVKQQMDFVRYLCLLSAYAKHQQVRKVARSYGYRMEEYIEDYVYSVVEDEYEELFGKFDSLFANRNYYADMERLEQTVLDLNLPKEYPSIINMDMYFFGLIYYVLLKHKSVDCTRKSQLKQRLDHKIRELKATDKHAQAPAQLQYMRMRIEESLSIYHSYLQP